MSTVMGAIGEATGMKPSDQVIATGALAAAKMKALFYCQSLLECSTPELRQIMQTHLQEAIAEQQRCADLMIKRGWYQAQADADSLVGQAVQFAQPALQ